MAVVSLPLPRREQASRWASTPCIGALPTSVGRIRLTVFREFKPVESQWRALQERGICTQAQTYAQTEAWFRLVSKEDGAEPAIVCGYAETGELQFIWPFEVRNVRGTRCLFWIGAERAAYNLGCHSPGFAQNVSPDDMRALIDHAARLIGANAARFDNQPFEWNGISNPFALLPHRASANSGHVILLDQDFDTLYRTRFGGKSRNRLRRKERRLSQECDVKIGWAETPAERRGLLEEIFGQKSRQVAGHGMCEALAGQPWRAFYHELAAWRSGEPGALEIGYVKADDHYAAISCGIRFKDRFKILLSSAHEGPTRTCSPGAILLQRQIEDACRKGLNFFDMGAGDPHDRDEWCDIEVPLFKSAIAFDERGYIVTASSVLMNGAKRFIKTRPAVASFAQDLRRKLHGAMGLPRH